MTKVIHKIAFFVKILYTEKVNSVRKVSLGGGIKPPLSTIFTPPTSSSGFLYGVNKKSPCLIQLIKSRLNNLAIPKRTREERRFILLIKTSYFYFGITGFF